MASRAQRFVDAAKSNVPDGTYAVGAGLLIAGVTAYGFQILANHRLEKRHYAALNSLWAVVFVVTPGLFQPLEQEVARSPTAAPRASAGARWSSGPRCSEGARGDRGAPRADLRAPDRAHAVPRPGAAAHRAGRRDRLLLRRVHHPRHALGQRPVRRVRPHARLRGHGAHPRLRCALRDRQPFGRFVRPRVGAPARGRGARLVARPEGSAHAGPDRAVHRSCRARSACC